MDWFRAAPTQRLIKCGQNEASIPPRHRFFDPQCREFLIRVQWCTASMDFNERITDWGSRSTTDLN
jgi:hypothetical protein